ncbi:Hypothetical predicted protein, partial [Paramuricea clavata]
CSLLTFSPTPINIAKLRRTIILSALGVACWQRSHMSKLDERMSHSFIRFVWTMACQGRLPHNCNALQETRRGRESHTLDRFCLEKDVRVCNPNFGARINIESLIEIVAEILTERRRSEICFFDEICVVQTDQNVYLIVPVANLYHCRNCFVMEACIKGLNCADLYKRGIKQNGVYQIDPDGKGIFNVFCDTATSGGGWTVFQRRLDGSVDFYRGWQDYKHGFGHLKGEFWLGLDKTRRLTAAAQNELRIDMEDTSGNKKYAEYDLFAVTSEQQKYQLRLGRYAGREYVGGCFFEQIRNGLRTKFESFNRYEYNLAQHSNITLGYFRMRLTAESIANSATPKSTICRYNCRRK